MADYYYGWARGKSVHATDVQVGTVTNNTDIELHVSTTHGVTKQDIIRAMEAFENFVLSNGVGTTTGPGVDLPVN